MSILKVYLPILPKIKINTNTGHNVIHIILSYVVGGPVSFVCPVHSIIMSKHKLHATPITK